MKAFRVLKKVLAAVLVVFIAVEGYYISQVLWYSVAPVKTSAYIESERERLGKVQFKPVRLRNISSEMVRAAVAAEDVRFMEHFGKPLRICFCRTRKAISANFRKWCLRL